MHTPLTVWTNPQNTGLELVTRWYHYIN
jgi:hypothetical protein